MLNALNYIDFDTSEIYYRRGGYIDEYYII